MSAIDYEQAFLHAADGIVVVNAAQRVVAANLAFAALVGVPPEAIVGRDPAEFITRADLQVLPAQRTEAQRDGGDFTMRRLRRGDGTLVPVEVLSRTMPDGSTLSSVRDARRRPLDDAIRAAESRLRAIASSLNVALVITDPRNVTLYANEHMARLTGYGTDALVGQDLGDFLATDADRDTMAARMRARRGGAADRYEVEHRRSDGSTFTAQIWASPMFDDEGTVVGSVGVLEDVTERLRRERELGEREQRYRSLFEVTPLPTWVFDIETLRFRAVNPAAIAHYGYTEEEFLSMTLLDIRTPEEASAFTLVTRTGVGSVTPRRVQHRRKDGSLITADLVAEDFILDGRNARIVVAHDVTEDIKLEALRHDMDRQLLLAQKMEVVGGLAGGVAHDFNNLLSVILGAAESIASELEPGNPLHDDLGDIRDAAARGGALTRQLLSLGRREVRAPDLLDLNVVVSSVARLLHRAIGPHARIAIRRAAVPLSVVADAGQLEQVLVNLAINARDAMPDGGTITIETARREMDAEEAAAAGVAAGAYVTLQVSDEGTGMDDATRARAFEPFFTTKGPHHGTGLGLSTVYGIARQSGGGVTLQSTVGSGTSVTLFLPLSGRTARTAPPPAVSPETGEYAVPAGRGRVLLVEDDPRVRSQARRLLERTGFSVIDAPDGAEGLFQFRARDGAVDVVVSDVMMPTMGGVEMVARLREEAPTVPVVFVSGYSADDRELPLDHRTLFVAKPYMIETLTEAIDAVLAG